MTCTCDNDFPAEVFSVRIEGRTHTYAVCWACHTYEWHSCGLFSGEAMSVEEAEQFCEMYKLKKK